MRRTLTVLTLVAALAMSALAPAAAKSNNSNSSRAVAQQVELTADDLGTGMCSNGEDVSFYTVQHDLGATYGDADDITFREPARNGPSNISVGDGSWDTLYLAVRGPDCGAIEQKGQVTVNYHYGDDIYTIVAQFNGKGELLHVNGVAFEG